LSFPKELTTGSSIMPHKQNPDVFELLRGKSNKIQNLPAELIMITNNLPSGYHRDFQLLKGSTMEAIETTKENLIVCHFMLENIIIHENIMDNSLYDYVYSVEELNKLVLNGMSFREAYQQLGKQILEGNFNPEKTVKHTHEGSIGNLCLKEIKAKFDEVF
jgi:argininosuccinate lyase